MVGLYWVLGEGWLWGPVMVTCLGSRCWWRAHGHPLGYQLTSHPPLSCGTCSSQPDLHSSICAFLMSRELGEWECPLFPCFGYTGLRSRPTHRVPGIFTDPGTYTSLSLPTTISLSSGHCPWVRDTHQHLVLLIFRLLYSSVPRSRKLY